MLSDEPAGSEELEDVEQLKDHVPHLDSGLGAVAQVPLIGFWQWPKDPGTVDPQDPMVCEVLPDVRDPVVVLWRHVPGVTLSP